MLPLDPVLTQQLRAFVTSVAIGLLIGLERERNPSAKAGLRTFALVAIAGTLSALIADRIAGSWVIGVGLLVTGGMMIAAMRAGPEDNDPGTTSVVALMICFCLGVIVWYRYEVLAITLGVATTALLYFKSELHAFSRRLTRKDLISILQFAALTFVILPILPDQDMGPYNAFNPYQIWWMVVLVAGVSLAGYSALRFVEPRHGAPVIGFFGGLVSSTATTLVFARHVKKDASLVRTASVVILIAGLMVMLRLALMTILVAPGLAAPLAKVLGAGLLCGGVAVAWGWRGMPGHETLPMPVVSNPTEIRTALTFGFFYGLVLFLAAWLEEIAGHKGLYVVAFISGLTDVDALTLSTLRLHNLGKLEQGQAVMSIALALFANLCFKGGLVVFAGGQALARRTLPGFAAISLGIAAAITLTF